MNTATRRLKQDFVRLQKDPVPYITAAPLPSNILEWHYVIVGPPKSPYEGGYYHGKLIFRPEFPFKPPSIYMLTPNGRFQINTRLCLSISDFHPDTWNPAWSVSTILTGLLSFMLEFSPTYGSIDSSDYVKRRLAVESLKFNLQNKIFCELFPDTVQEIRAKLKQFQKIASLQAEQGSGDRLAVSKDKTHHSYSGTDPRHHKDGKCASVLNLVLVVGFAAFACTVRWILTMEN